MIVCREQHEAVRDTIAHARLSSAWCMPTHFALHPIVKACCLPLIVSPLMCLVGPTAGRDESVEERAAFITSGLDAP